VHTGFDGPATGPAFDLQKKKFQQKILELLGNSIN